jgi:hypothetical protein
MSQTYLFEKFAVPTYVPMYVPTRLRRSLKWLIQLMGVFWSPDLKNPSAKTRQKRAFLTLNTASLGKKK